MDDILDILSDKIKSISTTIFTKIFTDKSVEPLLDFTTEVLTEIKLISDVDLSDMLYSRQDEMSKLVSIKLKQYFALDKSIEDISKLLYKEMDKSKIAKIIKPLPKDIQKALKDKKTLKRLDKLKTADLKEAYQNLLLTENEALLNRNITIALNERNRYYANRIARTEVFRAYSISKGKEHMADDDIEFIKISMSQNHPRADICDIHAKADIYGLGAGIYPKAKAPLPPFHPFCRCKMIPKYSLEGTAKYNPKATTQYIKTLPKKKQLEICGRERLSQINKGADYIDLYYKDKRPMVQLKDI